jgi:two-component system, LuxR family, sensor kinase FixL
MDMVSDRSAGADTGQGTDSPAADFDEISGIIAHEIAQPLTAILGDAEAGLRSLGDNSAVRDILVDIIASVQRASEIIRRARVMLQEGGPRCQAHSLNELVLATLRVARSEIVKRGVTLELHLASDMECVRVDRVQIEQVILNLIVNACEAMETTPPGGRRLRIATRRNPHEGEIELRIEDSGVGIAAAERERIFQPFVSSKPGGLGLGLAICRFIVRAHGGDLWAEAARRGARFCMRLPKAAPFTQVDWIKDAGLSR